MTYFQTQSTNYKGKHSDKLFLSLDQNYGLYHVHVHRQNIDNRRLMCSSGPKHIHTYISMTKSSLCFNVVCISKNGRILHSGLGISLFPCHCFLNCGPVYLPCSYFMGFNIKIWSKKIYVAVNIPSTLSLFFPWLPHLKQYRATLKILWLQLII